MRVLAVVGALVLGLLLFSPARVVAAPVTVAHADADAAAAAAAAAALTFVHAGRVWTMAADGSGRRALALPTRAGGRRVTYDSAAWSPDGRWLAVTAEIGRGDRAAAHVEIVRPDGTGARRLTRGRRGQDGEAAWSPDGRRVAFVRFSLRASEIVVADADGSHQRVLVRQRLFPVLGQVGEPAWSPDGRWIAYTRTQLGRAATFRPNIYLVRPSGARRHMVLRDAQSPAWSPDGRRLAVSSVRDRHGSHEVGSDEDAYDGEIYVVDADGRNARRLTDTVGNDDAPAWSPDGTRIAFSSDRNFPGGFDDNAEIYTLAADGGCLRWLTNGAPASSAPAWRPGAPPATTAPCDGPPPAPTVDVDTRRAARVRGYDAFWLGAAFGTTLLSSFFVDGGTAAFVYSDCTSFDPKACGVPVQVLDESVCAELAAGALEASLAQAVRLDAVRGGVRATYSDGDAFDLFTGTSVVSIRSDVAAGQAGLDRFAAALRRYGDAAPAALEPPLWPRAFARRLARVTRAYASLHSVRAVARRLHLSRGHVRDRLRIAGALQALGPHRSAPCPRR